MEDMSSFREGIAKVVRKALTEDFNAKWNKERERAIERVFGSGSKLEPVAKLIEPPNLH